MKHIAHSTYTITYIYNRINVLIGDILVNLKIYNIPIDSFDNNTLHIRELYNSLINIQNEAIEFISKAANNDPQDTTLDYLNKFEEIQSAFDKATPVDMEDNIEIVTRRIESLLLVATMETNHFTNTTRLMAALTQETHE